VLEKVSNVAATALSNHSKKV